jgi:hypothetical protein
MKSSGHFSAQDFLWLGKVAATGYTKIARGKGQLSPIMQGKFSIQRS